MADPRDTELRQAALDHVRDLQRRYNDLVPKWALAEGFRFRGSRVSFGSFYSGIFRPKQLEGPAALCLVTAPPKNGRPAPYDDEFDEATDRFTYRFRATRTPTPAARIQAAADNRALVAAHELAVPLIYFRGIASSQYAVVAPTFVREATLLQAAHIIDDRHPTGHATVINGISLCAIHHLAYDRNLLGIDPAGVVHIARRLLDEIDGPMLRSGLQEFHGAPILQPRRGDEKPDPDRLQLRFEQFTAA